MPSPPTKVVMILTLGFTSEFNMTMAKISYLIHECHRPVSAFITLQEHTSTSNFKNSSTLSMRIIAENYSDIIKTRLENFDRFRIQKGISPGDLSKILLYRQEIENLGDSVRAMAMTKIDFYTTLSSHPVDFNRLTNYALDLKNNAKAFEKTTSKLIKMNKRNLQLQTEIASYELCVLERGAVSSDCMKMIREIRSEEMNSREKKLKDRDVFDRQLDLYDSDNAVLFVTCHKSKFRIADFTANAPHMLEFPHDMMNGMEINKFMPKTIADVHDKYIVNFMNGFGKHHLKEPVKTVMQTNTNYIENVQQEQNYCKSITVAHQIEFRLSGDLYIVGLLAQRSKETKAMLYTDTSGRLIGQSRAAHSKLKVNSEYFVQNKFACMLFPRLFRRYFKYGALDIPYLREDGTINHPVMLTNKFLKKQQMLESGVQEDEQEIGREEQKTDMQEETFFQSRWNSSKMQTQLMIELQTLLSEYNQRKFLMTIAELKDIELQILSVSSMIISKDKLHISEETSPRSYCILRLQTDKYSDNSSIVEIDILSAHSLPFAHSSVISLLAPLEACTFFELLTLSPSQILLAANYLYLRCCSQEKEANFDSNSKSPPTILDYFSRNFKGKESPSETSNNLLRMASKASRRDQPDSFSPSQSVPNNILDLMKQTLSNKRSSVRKSSAVIQSEVLFPIMSEFKLRRFESRGRRSNKRSGDKIDDHGPYNINDRDHTEKSIRESIEKQYAAKNTLSPEYYVRGSSPSREKSLEIFSTSNQLKQTARTVSGNQDTVGEEVITDLQKHRSKREEDNRYHKGTTLNSVTAPQTTEPTSRAKRTVRKSINYDAIQTAKQLPVLPSKVARSKSFDQSLLPSSAKSPGHLARNNISNKLQEIRADLAQNNLGARITDIGELACVEISTSQNIDLLQKLLNLVFAMDSYGLGRKKIELLKQQKNGEIDDDVIPLMDGKELNSGKKKKRTIIQNSGGFKERRVAEVSSPKKLISDDIEAVRPQVQQKNLGQTAYKSQTNTIRPPSTNIRLGKHNNKQYTNEDIPNTIVRVAPTKAALHHSQKSSIKPLTNRPISPREDIPPAKYSKTLRSSILEAFRPTTSKSPIAANQKQTSISATPFPNTASVVQTTHAGLISRKLSFNPAMGRSHQTIVQFESMPEEESFEVFEEPLKLPGAVDVISSQLQSSVRTRSSHSSVVLLRRQLQRDRSLKKVSIAWDSVILIFSIAVVMIKAMVESNNYSSLKLLLGNYDSILLLSRMFRTFGANFKDPLKQNLLAFYPITTSNRYRMNNHSHLVLSHYDGRLRKLFAFTANNYSLVTAPLQITLKDYPDDLTMCKLALTKSERLPHRLLFIMPIF
jgi:hypothetical protein